MSSWRPPGSARSWITGAVLALGIGGGSSGLAALQGAVTEDALAKAIAQRAELDAARFARREQASELRADMALLKQEQQQLTREVVTLRQQLYQWERYYQDHLGVRRPVPPLPR